MASKPLIGLPISLHKNPQVRSRQFNALVRNIITTHRDLNSALPAKLAEGYHWYDRANELAEKLGDGNLTMGAGVLAAMSPKKRWLANIDLARRILQPRKNEVPGGHFATQIEKALKIKEGEDPETVLKGRKELNFFRNISNPDNSTAVTIDRHAHDIGIGRAVGDVDRGLSSSDKRYDIFHSAYTTAAGHLGIEVPSRLQAQLWVPWSERNM